MRATHLPTAKQQHVFVLLLCLLSMLSSSKSLWSMPNVTLCKKLQAIKPWSALGLALFEHLQGFY